MLNGLRQKAVVQLGGIVEVQSSELPAGATVEVVVLLEPPDQLDTQGLSRFIEAAQGNFVSLEDVDQFICQARGTLQYG